MLKTQSSWPHSIAICGWSGSGKTWALERLIGRLQNRGLRVGVVKHDSHHLKLDSPQKDTGRFWQAGAHAVIAHDNEQLFLRMKANSPVSIKGLIESNAAISDIFLLEGHKSSPWPKLWLAHPEGKQPPDNLENVIATIPFDEARLDRCEQIIFEWFQNEWAALSLNAGILIGGRSKRMGRDKYALKINDVSLIDYLVQTASCAQTAATVLIGEQPGCSGITVPDARDAQGPLAGLLSAMRWDRKSGWLFLACDMPLMTRAALQWLIEQRRTGVWAVLPKDERGVHPLGALYEPPMRAVFEERLVESDFSLHWVANHPKIKTVDIPYEHRDAWTNCNTPDEWESALQKLKG